VANETFHNPGIAVPKAHALYICPRTVGSRYPVSVVAWCILPSLRPPQKHGALATLSAYERDLRIAHLPASSSVIGMGTVA
jgi:hypothetical protein